MNMKSSYMGGLALKPIPKIVTKNDNKQQPNHNKSSNAKHLHPKNSTLDSINSMVQHNNQQPNYVLSGNSLNQLSSSSIKNNQSSVLKNRIQFIKQAENIIMKSSSRPTTQQSVSLLKKSPVKMQSLLQKRSILNSLMKTTINPSSNSFNQQQEKIATSTATTSDCNRVDDKMIKVIKLCVTRLEFSSPLFRRIATKMSFLYVKPTYEEVRSYERFCSTSNKAVLKQVMNKAHTLKYKPARNRSRMLRSNEIVDGKVMISWQRGTYVHVYTFNRRQRLRRYRQISMDFNEHRTLQIMYGLKKVTLPKIVDCPYCKKRLNPDGHYCVVSRKITNKRLRSSSRSLLKRTHQQVQLNDNMQTSDYVSNESDNNSFDFSHQFTASSRNSRSLLEDSKINLQKLSRIDNDAELLKRCPTLLLDSSNYKSNQNSISNVIVRRMDSKELKKRVNSLQRKQNDNMDRLEIKKVNSLPMRSSLIKCSIMDQHSKFAVHSMENSIKIVFK